MKTLEESFLVLILVAIVVTLTGSVLSGITVRVQMTGEREVLVVYPALIAIIGGVGAIIGSTATTKLAVGLLDASLSDIRNHMSEILSTWSASIVIFALVSFLSLSLYGKFSFPLFVKFTFVLLITNVTAAIAIVFVSFATAILTFQRGLDPDNFVIPVESVLADGMTSISLLMALFLMG
jgi:mgtE-like transporter